MSVEHLLAAFLLHSIATEIAFAQEGAPDSPAPEREVPAPADYTTPQGFVASNAHSLDLYIFRQDDDGGRGGNPLTAEGFDYAALRLELTLPVNEERTLRGNAVLAYIQNDETAPVPPTVINATTTSASGDILTLDALVTMEITPKGSPWSYTPGIFYHQQIDFIGVGFDFGVSKTTNNGDTVLGVAYSFRWDFLELNWWDGTNRGSDERFANNLLFSWEQNFTRDFRMNLALQYTRQDGFLSDQYNFVALFTPQGVPFFYADERLPDSRNRGQLNARLRWSPKLGRSIGLDLSYYADDWDVEVWSVEPSFQTTLGLWSLRVWYRYADQSETRYFRRRPTTQTEFQTQDSDLGSFTLQAPGVTLYRPLGRWGNKDSALRFSVWGFDRDDGIDGLGAKIGVVLTW